jgi:voltage-gated potassium channel
MSILNKLHRLSVLRTIYISALLLLTILAMGVIGFVFLEDYSALEAFYMTVITLSTVGFKEVRPLSGPGQLFTAMLIISSFGIFAYAISQITRALISGDLAREFKIYRLDKTIRNLNNHTIICGFGRNGRRAAEKLTAFHKSFVVIEQNQEIIEQYLLKQKIPFISGDATKDETLIDAGIASAQSLITTLSKDADNLYTVISARALNSNMRIVSRAANYSAEKKLKAVGANSVVMPEGVGGAHMATLTVSPNIVEFLEHISVEGSSAINLEEVDVSSIAKDVHTRQLKDLELRQKTGCSIIGLKTADGSYIINPSSEQEITKEAKLFVLGKPDEIEQLYKYLAE